MPSEKSNILRRKIETGAVYAVIGEAGGDASKRVTSAVAGVLTEHYKTKSSVKPQSDMTGTLGELIEKNGENRRGFLFRIEDQADCVVLMDPAAIMAAATWAHEGAIPEEPAAPTVKISTIDQRLASMLASEIIQAILAGDDDEEANADEKPFDLVEISGDASRFIVGDESLSAVIVELEASTMDDVALGTISLLLPDLLLSKHDDEDEAATQEKAAKIWANSMATMVGSTPIETKAIIATQNIDLKTLSAMEPGHVITLRGASLDAVTLQPENCPKAQSLALGAVRSFDGMRTVQILTVESDEAAAA